MSCATERACTCPTCAGLVEASSPESYRLRRSADRALHATGTGGVLEFAARTLDLYATHAPRDLNPQVGHWLRVWTRAAIEGAPLARGGSCGPRAGPALRRPWPPRLPQLGAPAKEISILATSDGGQGGEHSPKDCENCARRGKWVPTGPGWKPPTTPGASGPEQPKPTGDVGPGPDTERDPVVTGGPSYKVYQCVLFSWTETIPVGKECLYQIMKSKMWICLMVSGKCDRKWTFTLWGAGADRWIKDPGVETPGAELKHPGVLPGGSTGDRPAVEGGPDSGLQGELAKARRRDPNAFLQLTRCSEFWTLRYKMPECILKESRHWWVVLNYRIDFAANGDYRLTPVNGGRESGNGAPPADKCTEPRSDRPTPVPKPTR